MRARIAIDDDILQTARGLAERDRRTGGQLLSDLTRKGLAVDAPRPRYRDGIHLLPTRPDSGVITMELVNRLRGDE